MKLLSGGLNLPCVISKFDSLFLSRACRLLLDSNSRQYSHVKYWLGLYLREYFPDMGQCPHAELISPYFQHMKALILGGFVLGDIEVGKLHLVTSKKLYQGFTSTFPPPKVVYKYEVEWSQVWSRLQDPVLEPKGREILFMIIHNIVANKDRVYRFNMAVSPNCTVCGVLQHNVHLFCECQHVREAWCWLRQRILGLMSLDCAATSNFEFVNLMFSSSMLDSEIVWLLGVYVQLVWDNVVCKKKVLTQNTIQAKCQQKYVNHHASNKPILAFICGLFI